MQWMRFSVLGGALCAFLACGGASPGPNAAVNPPSGAGTVLVIDDGTQAGAPAALMGFVHGLHTIVVDGDEVFAGMRRLEASGAANGVRALALGGDLAAELVPAGDGFELRFSTGESVRLRPPDRAGQGGQR